MAEDAFKPVLKRKANKFARNTRFDHELHSAMSYESTNRFTSITEGNVEFESVEQDVVDSGADRAEKHLPRKTTRVRVKEDFCKVSRKCQIETTNQNKDLNFLAKSKPLGLALHAHDYARENSWRHMSMAVESGACKTVVNPTSYQTTKSLRRLHPEQVKVSLVHLAMRYPSSVACKYQL